jgi:hypothetical protein
MRQMVLVLATGLPTLVIMPILFWGSRRLYVHRTSSRARANKRKIARRVSVDIDGEEAWSQPRGKAGSFGNRLTQGGRLEDISEVESNERLLQFSLYWSNRFWFALMIWMWFVAFISAQTALQATPVPTLACDENGILIADGGIRCYSDRMMIAHLLGLMISTVFAVLLPVVRPHMRMRTCTRARTRGHARAHIQAHTSTHTRFGFRSTFYTRTYLAFDMSIGSRTKRA